MISRVTARVYVSDTLVPPGEDWTELDHLWCGQLTMGVAPTIDQASLTWNYGTVARPGENWTYDPPLAIEGKYVRIEVASLELVWYGYVLKSQMTRGPQKDGTLTYGDQSLTAVGLEWFLARELVNFSIVNSDKRIERAIGFNCGLGNGRGLEYEKRANKQSDANQFASDQTAAVLWNGRTSTDYLLAKHNPKNAASADSPLSFVLADDSVAYIDWFHPTVQTEGKSVHAVLSEIISRNRALVWWIEVEEDEGDLYAIVYVDSMATDDVTLPGSATLPANSSPIVLTDINSSTDNLTVIKDLARHYDVVIVRGARKRAVFTVSWISENLIEGWRDTDETDYRVALGTDPNVNDRYREANKLEKVYQVLVIPPDWDGASNDGGSVPGSTWACPKLAQGGTSIVSAEPIAMPGLRLLSALPTKQGYDYANATEPIARDPSQIGPEFAKPFAVINIGDDKFRMLHKLGTTPEGDADERFDSYHLHIIDGTPGFQVTGVSKLPHTLAKFTFDPDTDGASNVAPELDYREIRATVCGEWDAFCEGKYPLSEPTNAPVQTLYVSIGDRARHDWLAENTIYDVEGDTLKTVTTGGALRDDRELCVQIAQIAHQWYGVERAEIAIELRRIDLPVWLGQLITAVGSGEAIQQVNSIVTQITLNFDSQTTSIMAGFAELDFAGLA